MFGPNWITRGRWLGLIVAVAGCKAIESPTSSVLAPLGPAAATRAPWLESATLTFVQSPDGGKSPAPADLPVDGVVQASHLGEAGVGSAAVEAPTGIIRVLAVRYPHPDGRHDYARAELVVAEANAPAPAADTWRTKLGRFIDSATPGVQWGAGVREAKGLDLSVVELQSLLAAAEKAASSGKATRLPDGVQSSVEVNGEKIAPSPAAALKLRLLAMRVEREGKLISYSGTAADLLAAVQASNGAGATEESGAAALVAH